MEPVRALEAFLIKAANRKMTIAARANLYEAEKRPLDGGLATMKRLPAHQARH
jgi:hypothetical protein